MSNEIENSNTDISERLLDQKHPDAGYDDDDTTAVDVFDGEASRAALARETKEDEDGEDRGDADDSFIQVAAASPLRMRVGPRRTVLINGMVTDFERRIVEQQQYDDARRDAIKHWPPWRIRLNTFVRESAAFERTIFFFLFVNCIAISLDKVSNDSRLVTALNVIDDVLTIIFFIEMVIKIVGRGFFIRPGGYFMTKVNLFDFAIVVITTYGLVQDTFFASVETKASWTVTIATTGRFLRPFRALNAVDSLRSLFKALQVSLGRLADVGLLAISVTFIFLIVGLQAFDNSLEHRCVTAYENSSSGELTRIALTGNPSNTTVFAADERLLPVLCRNGFPIGTELNASMPVLHAELPPGWTCPWGQYCLPEQAPELGFDTFSDPVRAGATLFSVMALDCWSDVMIFAMQVKGNWTALYFVAVEILVAVFLFNLVLVILTEGFTQAFDAIQEHSAKRKQTNDAAAPAVTPTASAFWRGIAVLQRLCFNLSQRWIFQKGAIFLALANTVATAVAETSYSKSGDDAVLIIHVVCTILLAIEVMVRLIGASPLEFFKVPGNLLDFVVSANSVIEVAVASYSSIGVFRSLNLLELHPALRRTVYYLNSSLKSAASNAILLVISTFLFAMLGVQLFSGKLCELDKTSPYRVNTPICDNVPRDNFDNMAFAVVTVFVIFCGNGWREIMANVANRTSKYSSFYFISAIIVGQFLIVSLFVAVIVNTVRRLTTEEDAAEELEKRRLEATEAANPSIAMSALEIEMGDVKVPVAETVVKPAFTDRSASTASFDPSMVDTAPISNPAPRRFTIESVRALAKAIVDSKIFFACVATSIVVSMVAVSLQSPIGTPYDYRAQGAFIAEAVTTAIFVFEAALKIFATGVYQRNVKILSSKHGGYFNHGWNIFDFALAIFSVVSVVLLGQRNDYARYFEVTRALRPFSIIGRFNALRIVFRTLRDATKSLGAVASVAGLVWLLFAICGTRIFGGQMSACTHEEWGDMTYEEPFIRHKAECLAAGYHWRPFPKNFDNLGTSLVTLFGINSKDLWKQALYMTSSTISQDEAPRGNANAIFVLFGIVYMLVTTFFVINVFLSVLVMSFFRTRRIAEREMREKALISHRDLDTFDLDGLDEHQRDYTELCLRSLFFVRPPAPSPFDKSSFRQRVRMIVRSRRFDKVLFGLAMVPLLFQLFPESDLDGWSDAVNAVNFIFSVFFMAASVAIPLGHGVAELRHHKVELVIGIANVVALVGSAIDLGGATTTGRAMTSFQLARLARVFWVTTGTRRLWKTFTTAAPSVGGMAFILVLFFYVYAVLGMTLFGRVKYGEGITPWTNFDSVGLTMLMLFRSALFDEWQVVMWGAGVEVPDCDPHLGECGNLVLSRIYFMTFLVASQWVGINCITAVLLDSFNESAKAERFSISEEAVHDFVRHWKHSADGRAEMTASAFIEFLRDVQAPLGPKWGWFVPGPGLMDDHPERRVEERFVVRDGGYLRVKSSVLMRSLALSLMQRLRIDVRDGKVALEQVFVALIRFYYGVKVPQSVSQHLYNESKRVFRSASHYEGLARLRTVSVKGPGAPSHVPLRIAVKMLRWLYGARKRVTRDCTHGRFSLSLENPSDPVAIN